MKYERGFSSEEIEHEQGYFESEMRKLDDLIRENDIMHMTDQQEAEYQLYRQKQIEESEKQWQAFRERVIRDMKGFWGA